MATGSFMANEGQELVLTRVIDAPANSCSKCGLIRSMWRGGGVPTDLLTRCASWTYVRGEPFLFT